MLKSEHTVAFPILNKKWDHLVITVCVVGRLYFPEDCY